MINIRGAKRLRLEQSLETDLAIAVPQASFGGEPLHTDVFDMGAAYAFHICQNHPFVDGNKRVGLASALVFLDINGILLEDKEGKLYDLMMTVAEGKAGKPEIAKLFRELSS